MRITTLILVFCLASILSCNRNIDSIINPRTINDTDQLLSKVYQDGKLVSEYVYDDNNNLSQLKTFYQDSLIRTETYTWNAAHQPLTRSYDGYEETYTYNAPGQLTKYKMFYTKSDRIWEEEYHYNISTGLIDKGYTFVDGRKVGLIKYKHDSAGNTTERKETNLEESFVSTEYRFTFDNKINPLPVIFPADLSQYNNITTYYHYNVVMSSMPPQYESTFEYNAYGLPAKETRAYKYGDGPVVYEYAYITKK